MLPLTYRDSLEPSWEAEIEEAVPFVPDPVCTGACRRKWWRSLWNSEATGKAAHHKRTCRGKRRASIYSVVLALSRTV